MASSYATCLYPGQLEQECFQKIWTFCTHRRQKAKKIITLTGPAEQLEIVSQELPYQEETYFPGLTSSVAETENE